MRAMDRHTGEALDRYITGNYGADQDTDDLATIEDHTPDALLAMLRAVSDQWHGGELHDKLAAFEDMVSMFDELDRKLTDGTGLPDAWDPDDDEHRTTIGIRAKFPDEDTVDDAVAVIQTTLGYMADNVEIATGGQHG